MKDGVKTSEFWLSIISIVLGFVKAYLLPDFPEQAFYAVIVYILARSGVKAAGQLRKG